MLRNKIYTAARLEVIAALITVFVAACTTFKGEIPVDLDIPETTYISPMNADGIQDNLVIPLAFPELSNLTIQGYRFTIFEAAGTDAETVIYMVEAVAEKRAQRKGTMSLMASICIISKHGIVSTMPEDPSFGTWWWTTPPLR